jgi:hypothetical protein
VRANGLYQGVWGRGKAETDFTLAWGSLFHLLCEKWIEHQDLDEIIQLIDLNLDEEDEDRYGRNKRRMQEAFIEWVKFRKADPIEILRTEQAAVVACLEGPCPYSEHGCGLVYGGRLDQIVRWNMLVGPLDIKTTVMEVKDPILEYKPNHQMEGYVWITSHLMGKPCWGAIVERVIINKSKIKPHRFPVPYSRDLILEWVENEKLTTQRFVGSSTGTPSTSGCGSRTWPAVPYPTTVSSGMCVCPAGDGLPLALASR